MLNKNDFYKSAESFLKKIDTRFIQSKWSIDHICYRSESLLSYERLKGFLLSFSKLLIESEVNGRKISTFKLNNPLVFREKYIDLVELPQPKDQNIYKDGFEHIEMVVDDNFEEIIKRFPDLEFAEDYYLKDFNQELKCKFKDYQVKFHYQSLESIINIEKNEKVFNAILQSNVLSLFKESHPLIAGTFPLGIETVNSDIDILFYANDFDLISSRFRSCYALNKDFKIKIKKINEIESLICSFYFNDLKFELFVQNIPTLKQRAFQHFQVEENLLKFGGEKFLHKIKELRNKNVKTEPAFAHALNISDDGYLKLLEMKDFHDRDYRKLFS